MLAALLGLTVSCRSMSAPVRKTSPPMSPLPSSTKSDQTVTLSSGRKLGFAEYGDPTGTPLFYFHGWPSSRTQGALLDDLGKEFGLRVISPDRPGLGLSDFQKDRTLLDWPPVLAELAEHLGVEKFHLMGVSGGGPYVLVTSHAMPDRVLSASVVCGAPPLKIVGTSHLIWTYRLALWGQRYTPALLGPGLAFSALLLRLPQDSLPMRAYVSKLPPRDQEALRVPRNSQIIMGSGRVGLESGSRAMTTDGNIYNSDWGFELETVTTPIAYWHGSRDLNIPAETVAGFVSRIPNARFTLVKEEGHYSLPLLCTREILLDQLGMKP